MSMSLQALIPSGRASFAGTDQPVLPSDTRQMSPAESSSAAHSTLSYRNALTRLNAPAATLLQAPQPVSEVLARVKAPSFATRNRRQRPSSDEASMSRTVL